MEVKRGEHLVIALEKFRLPLASPKRKISKDDFVGLVAKYKGILFWLEETEKGKSELKSIEGLPKSSRERFLEDYNKKTAYFKEGSIELLLTFNEKRGYIFIDYETKLPFTIVQILKDFASFFDGKLVKNGSKVL